MGGRATRPTPPGSRSARCTARVDELPRDSPDRRHLPLRRRARARSPSALIDAGYDAVNLDGGMRAWAAEDYEVVAGDGLPGVVI